MSRRRNAVAGHPDPRGGRASSIALLVCWPTLQSLPSQQPVATTRPSHPRALVVGKVVQGRLGPDDPVLSGHGSAKVYAFAPRETGTVTVSLESFDFDAFLRVETEAGESVAEDDNGGVETNARLVLDAKEGVRFRVFVGAEKEGTGEFTVSAAAGDVPRPAGAALLDAGIAFHARAADRALARGDRRTAAGHRLEEGLRNRSRLRSADARPALEVAHSLYRDVGDRGGEAAALGNLSLVDRSLGNFPKAREDLEECLAIYQKLGDRAGEANALLGLGNVCCSLGDYPRAREHFERRLELVRELGDRGGEAGVLGNLGIVYHRLGDYPKAREHHERALSIARELGDRARESKALLNLGSVFSRLGDYPRAREHFENGLGLAREVGDRDGVVTGLLGLGNVYDSLGDMPNAREYYEKCHSLAQELGNRTAEARALMSLGMVFFSLGDLPKARGHLQEALDLARGLDDREQEATILGNLGVVHEVLGDFPKAREHYEGSLAIARELGLRPRQANALGNLANLCRLVGDLPRAREQYEKVLALAQELEDRRVEAKTLANLGLVHYSLGDYSQTRDHHEAALSLMRRIGDRAGEAHGLLNLGNVHKALGDGPRARSEYEESLSISREIGDREGEAYALHQLGEVRYSLGQIAGARESANAALEVTQRLGSDELALYPLQTLARVAVAEGDAAAAMAALERAVPLLDRPVLRGLNPSESAGVRGRFIELGRIRQDLVALRVAKAGDDAGGRSQVTSEGFHEAGRWKGRALLEGIAEHRAGGRSAKALALRRERREALAMHEAILERVSKAVRDGKPAEEIERQRGEAGSKLAEAEALAVRLLEESPADAAVDLSRAPEPEEVRKAIGKGGALVDYAEGEKRLYVYVLTEKGLAFVDLGERAPLEAAAGEYAFSVGSPEIAASVLGIAEKGQVLYERLLAPVLKEAGEGVRRLVIVPTPALAALPFEALVAGKTEKEPRSFANLEFVLDRYEVCYAPSSPVLVELASLGPRRGEDKLLVLSDPLYPAETGEPPESSESRPSSLVSWGGTRAAPDPGRLERLRKTREEAVGLVQVLVGPEEEGTAAALTRLSEKRSASVSGRFFDLHLGAEASRARLAGDLRRYSVLHFAAHGYVDREFPQRTGIALSYAGGEEGLYTIGDVLDGLDLDAKFVVLSACDTARGEVKRGEGVESMARAFMYAGARGVVASLWQVADWAAAETMGEFYRGALKRGLPPSQALWEAKRSMRSSERSSEGVRGVAGVTGRGTAPAGSGHPFFWAPFIYIGLPR